MGERVTPQDFTMHSSFFLDFFRKKLPQNHVFLDMACYPHRAVTNRLHQPIWDDNRLSRSQWSSSWWAKAPKIESHLSLSSWHCVKKKPQKAGRLILKAHFIYWAKKEEGEKKIELDSSYLNIVVSHWLGEAL